MPTTWNVPAQGALDVVIGQAHYGDTIIVASSYQFAGPLLLPNKGAPPFPAGDNRNYITIQTDQLASLPVTNAVLPALVTSPVPVITGRVSPSNASLMPKITAPANTDQSALDTAPGAQYYRFIGIEFNAAGPGSTSNPASAPAAGRSYFVRIDGTNGGASAGTGACGSGIPTSFSDLPSFFQFDRCYIHSFDYNHVCLHGVCLWTLNADVCNCYISAFNGQHGDAQAIQCIGPGPYNLINNYCEATGENIFFGRGDCADSFLNNGNRPGCGASGTAQTFVQYNSLVKNDAWRFKSGATFQAPTSSGNYLCKNLFEVKNGKNISFDHNYCENAFDELDQHGVALAMNIINYFTTGWEGATNITITNNVINRCCAGMYIAWDRDAGFPAPAAGDTIVNIKVQNNLFIRMSDSGQFGNEVSGSSRVDDGRNFVWDFGMIGAVAVQGLTIDHNTFMPAGAPVSAGAQASGTQAVGGSDHRFLIGAWQLSTVGTASTGISGFAFTNNVVQEQEGFAWAPNGFGGASNPQDVTDFKAMCPSAVMGGNVVYTNPPFVPQTSPMTTATFMSQFDPAHTNYSVSSLSAVGLQNGTGQQLSFPSTNGQTVTVQGYLLPSSSTFKATDTLNSGVAGCDISKLPWTPTTPLTPTTTTLSASPTTVAQGASVTLTATVTGSGGTPTGSVQFSSGSTSLGSAPVTNGTATLAVTTLPVGTDPITAVYSGDSTFAGSTSNTVNVIVSGASTTLTITTPTGAQAGQPLKIIVAVSN